MKKHCRAWFSRWAEVDTDDPTKKRRGQFLSYCILSALVFAIFFVVMHGSQRLFAPTSHDAPYIAGDILSIMILAGLWRLNRAGRTPWAGYGFLILSTVAISVLSPPVILDRMLSLPVIAASFIVAPASSFFIAGLTFASRVLVYLTSGDLISHNVISTAALFLVATIAWLVANQQERYIEQVTHLNVVLGSIRSVNQLIAREKDKRRLLQTSCALLTDARGYQNAWIGLTNSAGAPIMTAEAGIGTAFAAFQEWWLGGQMPGCVRQALGQSDAFPVRDPTIICADCPLVDITGQLGARAVRLAHEGSVLGVLVVSGPHEFLANTEEHPLLEEIAGDLAFALHSIDLETQQKQAEAVLKESEERYRTLIEQASDGVFIANDKGEYIQVNSAGCQMLGYTREEILQKTMRDLTKPEPDRPLRFDELRQGKTLLNEREMIRKDGTLVPVEISAKQLADGSFQGIVRDITERMRAFEAIQSLAKFPDENPNPVLRVAGDSTLLYANAGGAPLLALWGCEVGARLPEDLQQVVSELFAAGTSREVEVICGDAVYSLIFAPLVDAGYANVYGRDITEGKRAEEAVSVSEARYRSLIKNQSDVIARSDLMGKLTFINDAYCRFFGKTREELLGTDFRPTVLPEDLPISQEGLEAIKSPPYRKQTETRHITPAGIRWLSWENSAVVDARGNVIELQGVGRDITERKRSEEALRRFAGRLAALNRLDHVIAANLEIGLVYDNFVKEMLSLVALERTSIVLLNEAEDQWQVTRQWTQHQPVILPGEWRSVKGSAIEWLVTHRAPFLEREIGERGTWIETAPLQHEGLHSRLLVPLIMHGQVVGALTAASHRPDAFSEEDQDILAAIAGQLAIAIQNARLYEQVQRHAAELEQRVLQRTAELEATNRELEAFAYSVSHDLRAPLRAIDGYAHMLTEDYQAQLDLEGQRKLDVVRSEARRMGQLIDDLLAFSRLGRQAIHEVATDMTALAREVFDELRQETPAREVSLRLADLPSAEADLSLLRQVWINLLSNALKFTRAKAPAEIEVAGAVQGNEIIYYVKDNGVGFDMQYVGKLFGVFQRLHGQDEFEGTGVGLALVQRIILRHGGRVWAEAQEYQGATFYFSLPRHKEISV